MTHFLSRMRFHLKTLDDSSESESRSLKERGQVLVIGLFVIIGLTLIAITVANVGIVIAEKMHAQDTVDAAAYSAAVMEARYMNLSAYVNRAIVANYNSMAFNTALWAVMDADDHGIAVITALLYEISAIIFIFPITTAFAPEVDQVADLFRDVIHSPLHTFNHYLDDIFAQDNKDFNQYIEMFNKDVLTMLEGILYAATQSARHEIVVGIGKEMNPNLLTTSVLGLGAEAMNYDELARAVDFVIRDTDARSGAAKSLNKSFDKMFGDNSNENNPLLLGAVTEASLDNFTAGRTRDGEEDLLRNFNTGNIASGATDAAEVALEIACYSVCWPECIIDPTGCCDCNADVSISLGAAMRDGYENKHDEKHVPVIARKRMREVNFFGLRFRVEGIPGISEIADMIGDQGHTSGERHNDIGNEANGVFFTTEEGMMFEFDRYFECMQTSGCKLNDMNILQAKLNVAVDTSPLFDDDHWDGTSSDNMPVCTWEVIPPAVCLAEEAVPYATDLFDTGTEKGVPKYDWQVDLDNLGFANYQYPSDNAQQRPSGTSAGSTDNVLVGPSIGVVGIKKADKIGGIHGLGIGNDYPITAMSRAQVYYLRNLNRPDEKPSMFNPHWVPRLAPINNQDTPVLLRRVIPFITTMGSPIEMAH